MRVKRWVIGAVALAAVGALAACSASSGSANGASLGGPANGAASAAPAPSEAAAAGAGEAAPAAPLDGADSTDLGDPRALIQTAELNVVIKHGKSVNAAADKATAIAVAAGGAVYSDQRESGKDPSAELTLKVPPAALPAVLDKLATLGKQQSRQLSTRDVTATVADVSSRVISAQAAIDSLNKLYTRATKVTDIIRIEDELAQREANLESLQAQQRALTAETSLATIQLNFQSAPKKAARKHHHHHTATGFVGGLGRGWHAFGTAVVWVGTAVATMLPFLITVLLLGAGAGLAWRRTRSRRPAPPIVPAAPGDAG
jgi:hypothetical protein